MSNTSIRVARVPQYLSVREFAERFGISTKTVGRWIQWDGLRVLRVHRQIRIAETDALDFIARHRK